MDVVCLARCVWLIFFFFKKKTAYDLRISDWSSDVCSSDLPIEHDVARIDRVAGGEQQGALDHVFKLADIAGPVVRRELVDRRGVGPGHRLARAGVAQDKRRGERGDGLRQLAERGGRELGRASCRDRVGQGGSSSGVAGALKKKKKQTSTPSH